MRVVINNGCGYSLSREALEFLVDMGNIHAIKELKAIDSLNYITNSHYSSDFLCDDRSNPDLVAVVEALGDRANGKYATLKVIEIPDGIEWELVDCEGKEHIAESHRTWE